jgi:drug/metabolite transporter (DMT)-like permease
LRDLPESLITKVNLLVASVVLVPVVVFLPLPTFSQLTTLMLFGVVQMAIPYLMAARGLKSVTAGEAGLITLIEPVASPLWAYIVSPATETPAWTTFVGGGFIVAALVAHSLCSRGR